MHETRSAQSEFNAPFFMLANIAVYILHISTNILDISLQSEVTSAPIQKLR